MKKKYNLRPKWMFIGAEIYALKYEYYSSHVFTRLSTFSCIFKLGSLNVLNLCLIQVFVS